MAIEQKKILEIGVAGSHTGSGGSGIGAVNEKQIAVELARDSDLDFRMWGGKDTTGDVTKWLAKDRNARVADLTVTGTGGLVVNGPLEVGGTVNMKEDVTIGSFDPYSSSYSSYDLTVNGDVAINSSYGSYGSYGSYNGGNLVVDGDVTIGSFGSYSPYGSYGSYGHNRLNINGIIVMGNEATYPSGISDGTIWYDGTHLKVKLGSTIRTILTTGP